jgi:hypothetical protein
VTYGEDDLTCAERARLGIGGNDSVYLVRDFQGDVIGVKVVDHLSNRENSVDLKAPARKEGSVTIEAVVKMVNSGMKKLPMNYAASMAPDGSLSRGYREGMIGYGISRAKERNGKGVSSVVGNPDFLRAAVGGGRKAAEADSYRPSGTLTYGEKPERAEAQLTAKNSGPKKKKVAEIDKKKSVRSYEEKENERALTNPYWK